MPYAPGVQDISGQLLAQGLGQFAHGISRGIEDYGRRQEENKTLTAQAKALETLLPAYAKASGVSEQEIEQFLSPSPDESPRARVAKLSQAMEGIVGRNALQSQQLHDQQIRAALAAEQQRQAWAAADRRDQMGQRGRVRALYGGQPSTEEIGAMLDTGGRFEDLGPATGGRAPGVAQLLAAGVDDPRLLAAVARAQPAESFHPQEITMPSGARVIRNTPKSVIPDPTQRDPKPEPVSQLGKLIAERDAYRAAGRADVVAEYDRAIKLIGVRYDAFGNPINVEAPPVEPKSKEEMLALVKAGKLTAEQAKAIAKNKNWQ